MSLEENNMIYLDKSWVKDKDAYINETIIRITNDMLLEEVEEALPGLTPMQKKHALTIIEDELFVDWESGVHDLIELYQDEILEVTD